MIWKAFIKVGIITIKLPDVIENFEKILGVPQRLVLCVRLFGM